MGVATQHRESMVAILHTLAILLATTASYRILIQPQEYCSADDVTRLTRLSCATDADCMEGYECTQSGSAPAFCFNSTRYYKIGCPCTQHEDCPEACYLSREDPTCGPWL